MLSTPYLCPVLRPKTLVDSSIWFNKLSLELYESSVVKVTKNTIYYLISKYRTKIYFLRIPPPLVFRERSYRDSYKNV